MVTRVELGLKEYRGTTVFDTCQLEEIQAMDVRPDDTWVLSHPRSGTTLTQEIVYLLNTNLDLEGARSRQTDDRFPFLDTYRPEMKYFKGLQRIADMKSPRLIKSHLHYHILPPQLFKSKCKKVYVMRNPKDVFVSCMMLTKYFRQVDEDFTTDQFVQRSLDGKAYGGPWWLHVRDFWLHREDPSLLIIRYEDIVKDMRSAVEQIARHLEVAVTERQVEQIVDHCQFDNMKKRESTNAVWQKETMSCDSSFGGHIRKGKIGDWRDQLSKTSSLMIEDMVSEKLSDLHLTFDYGS